MTDSKSDRTNVYLSKSLFIKGLQCHKALYLHKYRPELKDEVSEDLKNRFALGYQVGDLAKDLFPRGVEVPYEGLTHTQQLEMTQSLIQDGRDTIYEAAFSHEGVFIKTDILHKGIDGWELYEVKASSKKEDYHVNDVAVQYHVITGSGLPISRAYLVHVNNQYVRQGDIDVDQLFTKVNLTETVKGMNDFIERELEKQRVMLKGDEPLIDIGPYCDDPFECDFKGHCWAHIPYPSVFDYAQTGRPNGFALYKRGIIRMEDVPVESLGWRQRQQHEGLLNQKNHVNADAVRKFLESLWYPLCFLDFETIYQVPIPLFDGTRPNQQVPFQFSLHIMPKKGGKLIHHEFLADGASNPQGEFLESLLSVLPKKACILTWNQGFEIGRLNELASAFPKRKRDIEAVIANIRDLMAPFRDRSIYHWQFNGSYSIKNVLPALVPELSYENLEISNGGMASDAWLRMIRTTDENEKASIRNNLFKYCQLDTYAMVKILKEMEKMVKGS